MAKYLSKLNSMKKLKKAAVTIKNFVFHYWMTINICKIFQKLICKCQMWLYADNWNQQDFQSVFL